MEIEVRVIAGTARRIPLQTVEGPGTRPTTDRIKETLFNMIAPYLADSTFLDLFSGSGAIGIEALSRGAKEAVFVEQNRDAVRCIRTNLKRTKLEPRARIMQEDVLYALKKLDQTMRFDYIFLDPPYHLMMERMVLQTLSKMDLLSENGVIIVEAALDTDFSYAEDLGYLLIKEKCYKTNKHVFFERREAHYA